MTQRTPKAELKYKIKHERGFFSKRVLGSKHYKYQKELLLTLLRESRVAVRSAHDLGKTFTIADAILEALYALGPCYIITTAPTWNLVINVLFGEIRKKYNQAKYPLGGRLKTTEVELGDKWKLIGFSPKVSVTGDTSTFQGFHAPLVIIVFEEATGIPQQIWKMAEGMMTSANVKWWAIGNPTDGNSEFAKCFESYEWVKIKWDCFLSPNLIANNVKCIEDIQREVAKVLSLKDDEAKRAYVANYKVVAPELLSLQWVISKAIDWGIDSPLFRSKVLAEFPIEAEDTFIPLWRAEQCMNRDSIEEGYVTKLNGNVKAVGVDIARFGSDNTEFKVLFGNEEIYKKTLSKKDLVATYTECKNIINKWPDDNFIFAIDATGIGSGVVDMMNNDYMIANNKRIRVEEIHFGSNAINETKYVNKVSEMAGLLADRIKSKEGLILQQDDILLSQLTTRKYKHDLNGRYWIEPKDDYKKRAMGKSCDALDALLLANYGLYLSDSASSFTIYDVVMKGSNSITSSIEEDNY